MKDFKTFLNEQKGMQASNQLVVNDKSDTIASLGHTDASVVLVTPESSPTLLSNYNRSVVYDFGKYLEGFKGLEGDLVMTKEDRKRLASIVKNMPEGPRKQKLTQQMANTMTLPNSADRTRKVQDIVNQIKQFDTQAYGVPRGTNTSGETFIPTKHARWGR